MKLLVFGGSLFLGRHVVASALDAGHAVTVLNRGVTPTPSIAGVERLRGDRDGDLSALHGRRFDAAIDCTGFTPRQLAASADALAGRVGHYVFVSSRSVYRALGPTSPARVGAPLLEGNDGYGASKARSEETIASMRPGPVTIARPGLIVGPFDPTHRFTYWPLRVARGGDVLAPGRPERPVQWIDARDLAAWLVAVASHPQDAVFDVVGPSMTMRALLDATRTVAGSDARFHWMPDHALVAHGVEPWTELPLWIPERDREFGGLMSGSDDPAVAAGLVNRPIDDTIRSTLAWARSADAHAPKAVATLTPAREAALLMALSTAARSP